MIKGTQLNIFQRLKEERLRLELTQPEMGEAGGVKKGAQINYEKGERSPDAEYFAAIASIGADVQYIITGIRSATALLADEQLLLERYRAAPAAGKQAILGAALGQQSPVVSQKYIGSVGQVVESVQGDGLSFNVTMPSGETAKRP